MAEQTSHNVVEKPESTSGSPLVDAAASQPTTTFADRGAYTTPTSKLTNETHDSSDNLNHVSTTNDTRTGPAAKDAAEPSAGDDADRAALLVNGVGDDVSHGEGLADDRSTAGMSVDASVNSDTDTSRADLAEKRDGNHHIRTNSVKKPTIFSKVTATKNFMSKVAPVAPIAPKVGEKPSPVSAISQPSSKPRLVAKTGASLANLQKSRLGTEGASGPDANKVWNKNRPTPQPTPRALTDEELKQQYGIHLATRLQSEENGKDSKWADIDDDEDDWAPEAVVWMDGTKSTLTPQDAVPPQQEQKEQNPAVPPQSRPVEGVRPTLALKQRSDNVKILKPGSAATQAKPNGSSVPSSAPDKGVLKAKSPAPAPAKSPWAPVPKVETVSPINPPIQQPQAPPKLATQDARAYEQPQPIPAREIAADTFDRSWKEGEGGTRELFNSTNGRYEPAPEGRRGSMKPETGFRKPAVLQRPSHSVTSPAEPSASFQSRTATQTDGSLRRRRGSSLSQGSVPAARRMSMNQRPDLAQTPEVPRESQSPASGRGEYVRPTFSQQSAWDRQMPPRPESGDQPAPPAEQAEAAEDPVKVQERIMREKRELARKRRQEEEQRAEAEKQERLKAKLASLEGAGKSKKERDAEAAAAAAAASSKDVQSAPAGSTVEQMLQPDAKPEPAKPAAEISATAASLPEAQSLPPAQSQVQAALPPPVMDKLPTSLPPKPPTAVLPERPASNEQTPLQQPNRQHLSPRANTRAPYQQSAVQYNGKTPAPSYSLPADRKLQPSGFERSPNLSNDAFTPWPTTAPNRNVWGTAGIGNGTFESSSAFAPVPMSQQNSALPPPPGMARPSPSARISPLSQKSRSPSLQQQQMSDQQRSYPASGVEPRSEAFTANQTRLTGISPAPGASRPHPPGPIGPPSRTQPQTQQSQRADNLSTWNNIAVNLPAKYASEAAAECEKRKQNIDAPVLPLENRHQMTFKKTSKTQDKLGAPRRYETTEETLCDAQGSRSVTSLSPAPPATQTQPSASFPSASPVQTSWRQNMDNPVRIPDPSKNSVQAGIPVRPQPIGPPSASQPMASYQSNVKFPPMPIAPIAESKDQSPPPPETESHPVNSDTNPCHPLVRLPKPQAKVKLPPTSPSTAINMSSPFNATVVMPPRPPAWGSIGASRPIAQSEAWQARFNGLFNRTTVQAETPPSPPKTPPKMQGPLLAVASSSRTVMDEQAAGATVSLPVTKRTAEDASSAETKPNMDEIFKEELCFGSKPKVEIPQNAKYNIQPYPAKKQYSNSQLRGRLEVQSGQEPFFWKHAQGYFVAIRGTRLKNKLCITPGIVDTRKDVDRKPVQHPNENRGWAERKPSQADNDRSGPNGRNSRDWNERKSALLHNGGGKEWSDRRQSKYGKSRTFNTDSESATATAGTTNTNVADGARQSGYQKPMRQPKTAPAEVTEGKSKASDPPKNDVAGGDKKKTSSTHKSQRNNRAMNSGTPATASVATPVKSN